jgi:hypothetical protein
MRQKTEMYVFCGGRWWKVADCGCGVGVQDPEPHCEDCKPGDAKTEFESDYCRRKWEAHVGKYMWGDAQGEM